MAIDYGELLARYLAATGTGLEHVEEAVGRLSGEDRAELAAMLNTQTTGGPEGYLSVNDAAVHVVRGGMAGDGAEGAMRPGGAVYEPSHEHPARPGASGWEPHRLSPGAQEAARSILRHAGPTGAGLVLMELGREQSEDENTAMASMLLGGVLHLMDVAPLQGRPNALYRVFRVDPAAARWASKAARP